MIGIMMLKCNQWVIDMNEDKNLTKNTIKIVAAVLLAVISGGSGIYISQDQEIELQPSVLETKIETLSNQIKELNRKVEKNNDLIIEIIKEK